MPSDLSSLPPSSPPPSAPSSSPPSSPSSPLMIFGLKSALIRPNDNIFDILCSSLSAAGLFFEDNDILVIAESALATSENRLVALNSISPGDEARRYAELTGLDAREVELILRESDVVYGSVRGVLLTLRDGILCPNAGIDNSNAPDGHVILYPENPSKSAQQIVTSVFKKFGKKVGVIVADSRTQPLRLGCTGVAIGAAGFDAVVDKRGEKDLFGKPLYITRIAVADILASAAEAVMGECGECIPFALIRHSFAAINPEAIGVATISADECMYLGCLKKE
ncbi:coenzyme F420-0:L-glutamate ligase [Methanolapillus millepedarum]|uniref:Bifunctional F420 biosynthesis protein FbiB n=1 Tax=Methanolapillus millepedarum TaxID=3028296 RepID=A0AA96V5B5_9EURY|nr:Bifunctional F420 biosynthesis protein FbiB [Methanosarcinaceae archaeon Ac7]